VLHTLARPPQQTLATPIAENLAASGVGNPVTAVLLNFRAYDTLLELAVLLTAVLGVMALGPARAAYRHAGPVFEGLAHWLVPVLVVTAAYLLWVGGHAPGGAFQAGATLAAAGVVLRLSGRQATGLPSRIWLCTVLAAGVGVFVLVGTALLLAGRPFLGYPTAAAASLILLIETAAMLSIAATLVLAFLGGRPQASLPMPGHSPVAASPNGRTEAEPETRGGQN
jgi:multisubunit Na+/H+ antiporter MnhB subunit